MGPQRNGAVGASDLLPHVHEKTRFALIFSTIAGMASAAIIVAAISRLHAH